MTEITVDVEKWVARYFRVKTAIFLAVFVLVLIISAAALAFAPFIATGLTVAILGWAGAESPLPPSTMIAFGYGAEVIFVGYIIVDPLASRYRDEHMEAG